MTVRYVHTNIISEDWESLANFYIKVFNCVLVPPKRKQTGQWLEKGTGVENAELEGVHLRLPGHGNFGPTLEIYAYKKVLENGPSAANKKGYGHIAFEVDEIEKVLELALIHGAKKIGELSENTVAGVGKIKFIYIADPDGNIIELQNWS